METQTGLQESVRDAEKAALGSMMLSPVAAAAVTERLTGPMFYSPAHETIYQALAHLYVKTGKVDAITATDYLTHTGELSKVGGAAYLHTITSFPSTAALAEQYAEAVRTDYIRRTAKTAITTADEALSRGGDVHEIIGKTTHEFDALTRNSTAAKPTQMGGYFEETLRLLDEGASGYPTGLSDLDDATGGLGRGTLTLIAGRPATGKSVVGLTLARNFAKHDITVPYFSLEMGPEQLTSRVIAAECSIANDRLRLTKPALTPEDWQKIEQKMPDLLEKPLYFDSSSRTVEAVCAHIRSMARSTKNLVPIIDYIGLLSTSAQFPARHLEISYISRLLKETALDLNIPIIALSQLNRGPESRVDKRPQVSDLRDSGSLEQDADNVILLHREDLYDRESPRAGEIDFILGKLREGVPKTLAMAFQGHYMRVQSMAQEPDAEMY